MSADMKFNVQYDGQIDDARKLAAKSLGIEKTAEMSDDDIEEWIDENFKVFCSYLPDFDLECYASDDKTLVLIPTEDYMQIVDKIALLKR